MTIVPKYLVDAEGNYLGAYSVAEDQIPSGSVEVPTPPVDARQKWTGSSWGPAPPAPAEPDPAEKLAAFLAANPDVVALINGA